jgi:hypothetical protein
MSEETGGGAGVLGGVGMSRKILILSKLLSKSHGRRNQDHESALPRCEVCQAEEAQRGKRREILGRMGRENSRYSRVGIRNPLTFAASESKRLGTSMHTSFDSRNSFCFGRCA